MSTLEKYKELNRRKTSVLEVGGFRPTKKPLATNFSLNPVGLPGESWPYHNGEPLTFICQLNLIEAPFVPEILKDIALITFFADLRYIDSDQENGQSWYVRAYSSIESLVNLQRPEGYKEYLKGFECRWKLEEDYPIYDDPEIEVPDGFDDDDFEDSPEAISQSKIGGWAANIQSEQWWGYRQHPAEPKFCFQISSEDKIQLMWGDMGIVYIARGTKEGYQDQWFLDWQCF